MLRVALRDEYPVGRRADVVVPGRRARPAPRQPEVPIWVGGSSKPALRRAAARGDGWLPQGTPRDEMPAAIAYLLEHRKATLG